VLLFIGIRVLINGRILCTLLFLLSAQHVRAEDPTISAWARATPPGATTGAIYGRFTDSGGQRWQASKIRFPGAASVMMHETRNDNGQLKMRHSELSIQPNETLVLAPGARHIMLMGLVQPLLEGCRYTFVIDWSNGRSTEVVFNTGSYGQLVEPDSGDRTCP
jgi:periplasmic copper chaperone A